MDARGGTPAHEMGHVLGLEHVLHICALMTPSTYVSCKPEWPSNLWQWRCRVLQKDDLAGAARRYGGNPSCGASMFCEKAPTLPAVKSMVVSQSSASPLRISQVTVTLLARRAEERRRAATLGQLPNRPE